jgi:hypothetical protein
MAFDDSGLETSKIKELIDVMPQNFMIRILKKDFGSCNDVTLNIFHV